MAFSLTAWLPLPIRKSPARRLAAQAPMPAAELLEERQLLSATVWVDPSSSVAGVYHTIQAAVDAADPGDTIKVAPGTYDESVSVNKTLAIIGGQHHGAGETGPSIVQSDTAAFTLGSNDTVLENFTIESQTTAATGIVTSAVASGDLIQNNLIENETYGLELNGPANAGAVLTEVNRNQFQNNVDDIFSNQELWNAQISNNKFTGSTGAAIDLVGSSQSNILILDNRVLDDGPIELANTTNSEIEHNTITNSTGDGILLAGGVVTTQVSRNALLSNSVPSQSLNGIELNSSVVNQANSEDLIENNTIRGFVDGILMTSAHSDTVSNNQITYDTGIGIATGNETHDDTFSGNTSKNNSLAGFTFDGDEEIIQNNVARYNGADGFDISGSQDTITSNTTSSDNGDGFVLSGDNATVSKNTSNDNKGDGFLLSELTGSLFSGNKALSDGGDGIHLVDSANNTVSTNVVQSARNNGIELDNESVGNLITPNTSQYSRNQDLVDASTGSGTSGTANIWLLNTAEKRGPLSLP